MTKKQITIGVSGLEMVLHLSERGIACRQNEISSFPANTPVYFSDLQLRDELLLLSRHGGQIYAAMAGMQTFHLIVTNPEHTMASPPAIAARLLWYEV